MFDLITLVWIAFVFFAAVILSFNSFFLLFQNKRIGFDRGFYFGLSACLIALFLCLSIWPPIHRVYHDEFIYISQSFNILSTGHANIIIKGSRFHPEAFVSLKDYPKLPGFAWLEAVVLFVTHEYQHSFFYLNIILGTLSVAVVYRIAWILSSSQAVAWWSAVFLACLPVRITYAMSAASDIAGLFFFLLFLLFICEYKSLKAKRILYAAIFCGIFSICIKPFYGILVGGCWGVALSMYKREGLIDANLYKKIWLDTVCLFLPILAVIPIVLLYHSKEGNFSLSFMVNNFMVSVYYLFHFKQNTIITAVAALAAVGRSVFYKKDTLVNALSGCFLVLLLMISVFFAGGITYPGEAYSDRYFLPLAFAWVFLAARGMVDVLTKILPFGLGSAFFILLLFNSVFATVHLTKEAKDGIHYKREMLLKQIEPLIPDEAYIMDRSAPFITAISDKKAIQTDYFLEQDHPQQVVFLKGPINDIYNSEDQKEAVLVENILNTKYRCHQLTAMSIQEDYLKVTPYICSLK